MFAATIWVKPLDIKQLDVIFFRQVMLHSLPEKGTILDFNSSPSPYFRSVDPLEPNYYLEVSRVIVTCPAGDVRVDCGSNIEFEHLEHPHTPEETLMHMLANYTLEECTEEDCPDHWADEERLPCVIRHNRWYFDTDEIASFLVSDGWQIYTRANMGGESKEP